MLIARLALLLAAVFAAALPAPFAAAAGAPAVTEVEVTSEPGADATYALGETIRVTVRFSEAVDVTGAPRLAIDMDPASWGEKRAVYASGSGHGIAGVRASGGGAELLAAGHRGAREHAGAERGHDPLGVVGGGREPHAYGPPPRRGAQGGLAAVAEQRHHAPDATPSGSHAARHHAAAAGDGARSTSEPTMRLVFTYALDARPSTVTVRFSE